MTSAVRASVPDTLRIAAGVVAPLLAQGVIRRRPRVVRLAERLDLDRRAARLMRNLRRRYGDGPVRLAVPGRSVALVLSADHVARLLTGSPEPFAPATTEKRAALAHFQPHGVLASGGEVRAHRRRYNERVLGTHEPMHRAAEAIVAKVHDEVDRLQVDGTLHWPTFAACFARIARRVTLGDAARDDTLLTAELDRLRAAANWAYLRPRREGLRERFQRRVDAYVRRAEAGCLAGVMAGTPVNPQVDPAGQVPHWLFAFDAAGSTAFRALALLAAHPDAAERARQETDAERPFLRACLHDTVRLWPTTLTLLRESTTETAWGGTLLPAGTTFLIASSPMHRDPERVPFADRFAPEAWLDGTAHRSWSIFPFSAGPAECPGRDLVLLVTGTLLARLLQRYRFTAERPLTAPLPRTLEHTRLRFTAGSVSSAVAGSPPR